MIEDQVGWTEVARAVPSADDEDQTTHWRATRELAARDAREWTIAGKTMHIQLGRIRASDLTVDDLGYVTSDPDLIDWGNLEVVPGLNEEELRAVEVLRDAENPS